MHMECMCAIENESKQNSVADNAQLLAEIA